jgi:2-polyprenyl-3-methyl-5-hydroxy-6-metoxy-1,4-benzoquinol methylase
MKKVSSTADTVRKHYDELLGPVYSWIVGDFESAYKRSEALFASLGIRPRLNAVAVDLGCGSGSQALALAHAGFRVTAIDFCEQLLEELKLHAGEQPIRAVYDDIMNFPDHLAEAPELIVCLGDTLVHLPNEQSVQDLLSRIAEQLLPGGTFIATLRDYSGPPPVGADRFIPIRSSSDRIFTCFLEHKGKTIDVHDILHTRHGSEWQLQVSHYSKLCLDYKDVVEFIRHNHMLVDNVLDHHGMKLLRARKPA